MPVLNESDVHIWYCNTGQFDSDAVKLADGTLSIEERTRRDRFQFETDRRDFTIAHDLLRRTLSKYADTAPSEWRFTNNEHGKPSIESTDPQVRALSFSLSSTRGCVACAISLNAPLGVDVERTEHSQPVLEIADRYFSEQEAAWLRRCSDELRGIRFTELWTLKEAYLKALGLGLFGSLSDVSFRFDDCPRLEVSRSSNVDSNEWHFALFEPAYNVRLGIVTQSGAQPRFVACEDKSDGHPLLPICVSEASGKHPVFTKS